MLSLAVIFYLMGMGLLAVQEWEREGMRTTNGTGTKTKLNLVLEVGMIHWEWQGIEEDIPVYLEYEATHCY